ncbi:MAG TPA: exodeoxyribonuclease VII large subunit [Gemmatimonadaceae bacterium]|nr:exodeoxyribonuclease VII large subunit [Gemmatimonadaceae bacterium]
MTPARRSRGAATPPREAPDLFALEGEGGAAIPSTPMRGGVPAEALGDDASLLAPGESPLAAISVATLTRTVKDVLEGAFPPLWVRGEVTDFKQHRNGHWYFTLRDQEASVSCVVWSRETRRIPAPPDEGMTVVALGQVTLYPARGSLQFSVKSLDAVGDGLWRKAFELSRARLERDGLLDPARKRPLPFFPRRIAVITSPGGAVLHDIVSVTQRRNALVELVLIPAVVQGDGAPASLCAALERLAAWGGADAAIIGRGGGSREDLWAFNDEQLARAVAACPVPIISAVGHEVDVTLCDLVADWRAPTPSAAAERAVPVLADLQREVAALGRQLQSAAAARVRDARRRLEQVARHGEQVARRLVERRRLTLERVAGQLHALSPLATMTRGYVVATTPAGELVASARSVETGDAVHIRFRDGRAETRVERVVREDDPKTEQA